MMILYMHSHHNINMYSMGEGVQKVQDVMLVEVQTVHAPQQAY